jgi:hypothetical protein
MAVLNFFESWLGGLTLRHLSIQRDAKNTKNPQVIWLSGFFIVQRSAMGFVVTFMVSWG